MLPDRAVTYRLSHLSNTATKCLYEDEKISLQLRPARFAEVLGHFWTNFERRVLAHSGNNSRKTYEPRQQSAKNIMEDKIERRPDTSFDVAP